jgi:histidine triad (HIT) family protein
VYEDDKVLAFKDINPAAPVHVLVVTKKHYSTFMDVPENEIEIVSHVHKVIQQIAKDTGISKDGFRVVNNCGEQGGQEVKHIHYHVLGGRNLTWPPG